MSERAACLTPARAALALASFFAFAAAAQQPPEHDVPAAITRATEFLLRDQNPNGSWGSQRNAAVGIDEFWSNPETHRGWRAATTGLCCMALSTVEQTDAVRRAYERGVTWLTANALVKRPSDWDVDNTWGYVYALQALVQAYRDPRFADSETHEEMGRTVRALLEKMKRYQSPDGGWGYYDTGDTVTMPPAWSTSFMTAAGIVALLDARAAGFAVEPPMFDAAVAAVRRCRLPNGAFAYSVDALPKTGSLEGINQIKGSLGRIQVCNYALRLAGDEVPVGHFQRGLDWFFRHHRFLDIARQRPIPHEAYYYNSGYFYFFGHYYAAFCIEQLSPAERPAAWRRLQHEIIKTQEQDGSMWDYYMNSFGKPYGTAFGLMALTRSVSAPSAGPAIP